MQNHCYKDQCWERVTYACNCSVPAVYCCDRHFSEHTRTLGRHINEYLIINLTQDQRTEHLPRLLKLLRDFQRCEHDIVQNVEVIVNCIQNEGIKALKNIKELKKTVIDLIANEGVNKTNYETIAHFINYSIGVDKIEEIKNRLSNIFEFNLKNWKECDEIIFSDKNFFQSICKHLNFQ